MPKKKKITVDEKKPLPTGGRPKKILEDEIDFKLVTNAGRLGLTDVELGILFNRTERTINRWKKNKGFLSALKKGKLGPDNEVVESLLKRARGYEYVEETTEYVVDSAVDDNGNIVGKPKVKSVKRIKKHIPADTLAATVWLNNRRPETWRRQSKENENEGNQQLERLFAIAHASMVQLSGAGTTATGNTEIPK